MLVINFFMKTSVVFYILGSLILSLIITDMILWIIIATDDKSFSEAVKEHLNHWPRFIKTPLQSTLVKISLGGVSILLFIIGYVRSKKKFLKTLGLVLIVLGGCITFWEIFTIM
jgi:hypothetical protein